MRENEGNTVEKLMKEFEELFGEGESGGAGSNIDELLDMGDPDNNIIILNDQDGKEVRFGFLDLIEYEGNEYVVLYPVDDPDDDGEVVILKVEESDGDDEETYASIDDEQTLYTVFDMFKEKNKDRYNFSD